MRPRKRNGQRSWGKDGIPPDAPFACPVITSAIRGERSGQEALAQRELQLPVRFEQLLSVKNVGPKVALAVLDIGSGDYVRSAIASGEVKTLQTAKGVGKRAAEQIVVELRDKVGIVAGAGADDIVNRGSVRMSDEAVLALVALGYQEIDAQLALQNIDKDLPIEERVKQALKGTK